MALTFEAPVGKKYVHKHLEENVFIKNLRRAIPAYFDKEIADKSIIPYLSTADKAIFLNYYVLHQPGNDNIFDEDSFSYIKNNECYVLFNIPHFINPELFENPDNPGTFIEKERKILLEYYKKNNKTGKYVLKHNISEIEEKTVYSILNRNDIYISDNERFMLAEMLQNVPDVPSEDIFYANLLINPVHSFFFEHPQDHVPGMMLLEAARQFTLACWHVYGKVPVKGVQFILNSFNSKFNDYVDLNYPAGLKGEILFVDKRKSGEWISLVFKTTIFQNGDVCGIFEIDGRTVSKKLFLRLREGRDDPDPSHRFYPIKGFNCTMSLWDIKKGHYIKTRLWDICYEGFRLEMYEAIILNHKDYEYDFIMCFEEVGFIRGKCRLVWQKEDRDMIWAGFIISSIFQEDKKNLKDAIKRYCHLRTDRERI